MADIFRGQGSAIARSLALLPALLVAILANPAAMAQLSEQPMLVVDPGMHTAPIKAVAVDAAGRLAVTGSDGQDGAGVVTDRREIVADDPHAGWARQHRKNLRGRDEPRWRSRRRRRLDRWTTDAQRSIYLFETRTGKMTARIAGLPNVTDSLAFSPDGRYLAAGLVGGTVCAFMTVTGNGPRPSATRTMAALSTVPHLPPMVGWPPRATTARSGSMTATSSWLSHRGRRPAGINPSGSHSAPTAACWRSATQMRRLWTSSTDIRWRRCQDRTSTACAMALWHTVTWSKDGKTLYAGGNTWRWKRHPVLAWADAGRGERRALPAGSNTVSGLAALPDGALFVAAQDPFLELLEPDGRPRWAHTAPKADFRDQDDTLAVSADGTIVDFGFELRGKSPLRFDLRALKLTRDPPADHQTIRAKQAGLAVEGWRNGFSPTLDGKPIKLQQYERSRSLAVHPDGGRFVLGADWSLQAIDAKGRHLWQRSCAGHSLGGQHQR